ncbi:hypothetical protein [uncultured Polaribacter sp.]|uniref:hypothetical protein n=1 Tax=uncultured Polaribacter sp. TaxID=174711 RepID=UPI0030D80AA5|tara:strand:- start:2794 stop:3054 length:261 start_codon:yes stop_codon:yes gene_type:complete
MLRKFLINCDQATTICDKNQYGEATILDKIKLIFHFLFCKICSLYSKQNVFLSTMYKDHAKSCKKVKHCLTDAEKAALKENIESKK